MPTELDAGLDDAVERKVAAVIVPLADTETVAIKLAPAISPPVPEVVIVFPTMLPETVNDVNVPTEVIDGCAALLTLPAVIARLAN